jgi:predicted transposase YbfD/YdcC
MQVSIGDDVKKFAHAVREHWGVENRLHWCLDVVFGEDQNRARTENAAENLSLARKWSLNLLYQDKSSDISLKSKQMHASLNPDYLLKLLSVS